MNPVHPPHVLNALLILKAPLPVTYHELEVLVDRVLPGERIRLMIQTPMGCIDSAVLLRYGALEPLQRRLTRLARSSRWHGRSNEALVKVTLTVAEWSLVYEAAEQSRERSLSRLRGMLLTVLPRYGIWCEQVAPFSEDYSVEPGDIGAVPA